MVNPFRVTVYNKAFQFRGPIGDPESVKVTPRHNLLGTAEVSLRMNHPRIADVMADGARLVIHHDGNQLMSGPIRSWEALGPRDRAVLRVTIHDDWRLLQRVLGWPVPTNPLSNQDVAYWTHYGNAETGVKAVVAANVARLGLPVTMAPNLNRGATVKWSWRFHPLIDRMALDAAGIGVRVYQVSGGLELDCYVPQVYPRTLTEASGVVQDWTWKRAAPDATRVVAGNQGEMTARVFVGDAEPGRELDWNDKIEVFRDARDTSDSVETATRMDETLADGAPTHGLSVSLSETGTFRYGEAVSVGDVVTLQVGTLPEITDVLREASLSWTTADGFLVTPAVGDMRPPESLIPRALAALRRQVQTLSRS